MRRTLPASTTARAAAIELIITAASFAGDVLGHLCCGAMVGGYLDETKVGAGCCGGLAAKAAAPAVLSNPIESWPRFASRGDRFRH